MASAEGGSVPSEVRYLGLGSVVSSPNRVRGRAPAENRFWRILKATEHSFIFVPTYMTKSGGRNLH